MEPNELLFFAAAPFRPSLAFALLVLGILLIYWELAHPGRVIPGVLGGVAMTVALNSLFRHPWRLDALTLIFVGICLIVLQALTGRWLAGGCAAVALAAGVRRFAEPPIHSVLVAATLPLTALSIFLLRMAVIARRRKRSLE